MGKRRAAHEHHGGAWKVAYGDFITSMMALFMLLWILTQNVELKEDIANYFLDPWAPKKQVPLSPGLVNDQANNPFQPDFHAKPAKVAIDQVTLWELAQQFYKMMKIDVDDVDRPIDIQLNSDGMFITIFDRDDQPIFVRGTTEFTPWGDFVMENVSWLLARVDMPVKIASHIPSGDTYTPDYTGWELTSDMSNAVRKSLIRYALPFDQILRVTGYSDAQPIVTIEPDDQRNQRIELDLTIPGSDDPKIRPTLIK